MIKKINSGYVTCLVHYFGNTLTLILAAFSAAVARETSSTESGQL